MIEYAHLVAKELQKRGIEFNSQFSEIEQLILYPAEQFGELLGRPANEVVYVYVIILSFVCSLLLSLVASPFLRKLLSVVMGVAIQLNFLGASFLLNVPLSVTCWLSMCIFPRNTQHYVTIFVTFSIMTLLHLYYELIETVDLNMSAISMVSFCKQMSLALNYKDGDKANQKKLTPRETTMMVEERPGLLTYLAYMFFPAQAVSGPFSEFVPFEKYINLEE